jgi:peptidoglycan/LPS O-acetylase OafA/YrhL
MTRTAEARFWQGLGAFIGIAGGSVLGYAFAKYGPASIEPRALYMGVAGSFTILAGGACYIAGRALHVEETALTATEAFLWKALALVCLAAGATVVVFAWRQHDVLVLDRLAMGLAGAFSMMFGVLCLVGERVMSHMHDVLVGEKAKRASAS